MPPFIAELKRRNVIRVTVAYLVMAWLLVQVMEIATDAFEAPAWILKIVMTLLALGLIPTVLFSWAYELTPDGIRRESDVKPEESVTAHTAKKLNVAVIALLVIAIGLFVADRTLLNKGSRNREAPAAGATQATAAPKAQANSIAVLPFVDLSPEGDQEYFSDGIAEEVLNVLVRVKALSVASRTSSFQFKGRDIGIPEIAASLKVRHVLEGSVRKAGDTLRITAQLIDTSNDRHLWSETFDRPLSAADVFEIQDEIAKSIVNALRDALGIEALATVDIAAPTDNLSAYELYLQAKPMFQARVDLDKADALLARALELDPEFVNAWELRAAINAVIFEYGGKLPRTESDRIALGYVDRAFQINPDSAMAIAVRANVFISEAQTYVKAHDWAAILADLQRALSIDPGNTGARNWLGLAWINLGYNQEAVTTWQECLAYDPLYTPCAENEIVALSNLGRDDEALARLREGYDVGRVKPIYTPLAMLARLDEEMVFKSFTNLQHVFFGWRRHDELYEAYKNPGKHEELAQDLLQFARTRTDLPDSELSMYIQPIGAYDLPPFPLYIWDASLSHYRQSPQFKSFIRKANIYTYWQGHGYPPQCRPVGNDNFECD